MPREPNQPNNATPIAGIVLAAGDSSRMGANKLLLELNSQAILRRAVTSALDAGLSPVIVVLGFEADRAISVLWGLAVETVTNREYARGMNSSAKLGVKQVPSDCSAAVVMLADMPFVTSEMISTLVAQYRTHNVPLVISRFGDVRAPPTLYDRSLFGEFTTVNGDGCGRQIVRKYGEHAITVGFPATALADLDSREDYEQMKQQLRDSRGRASGRPSTRR